MDNSTARCVTACLIALLTGCTMQGPVPGDAPGVIRGVILPSNGAAVCVAGTNLCASADSTGKFTIYGVREGDYALHVAGYEAIDSMVAVHVEPGETVDLDTIRLQRIWADDSCEGIPYEFQVLNAADSSLVAWDGSEGFPDSIYISILVSGRVVFIHNGGVVADDFTAKVRPHVALIHLTGTDTVTIARTPEGACGIVVIQTGAGTAGI